MKVQLVRRLVAGVVCAAIVLLAAMTAYAEVPAASAPGIEGLSHRWVAERLDYKPYTAEPVAENAALKAAKKALRTPSWGVARAADHGYAAAKAKILLAGSLVGKEPAVVGHEVVVWGPKKAARFLVGQSGYVALLGTGDRQDMIASATVAGSDAGDRDAVEIARRSYDTATELGAGLGASSGALIAAHAVGFADGDGSHLIVRVDPAGRASYPEW